MILLNMRTIILSSVVTSIVCMLVVFFLWRQSRKRFAGTDFWALDFAFQTAAIFLIIMRGSIPGLMSIVLANTLVIGGAILGYIGLGRFVGKKISQFHNYVLLAAFACVHAYFTFVQPSLAARNLNLSVGLLIICFQCMWFLVYTVEPGMRPLTRAVGTVFGGYCLVSIVRIIRFFTASPASNDYFHSGAFESLIVISYQILFILLTYTLALMVNKRLLWEVKIQEEKFTKAFRFSPSAMMLTRLSNGEIIDVNDGFLNITGYEYVETIGKTMVGLRLWDKEEDRVVVVNELSKSGKVQGREFRFRKESGEVITGLFSSEIIQIDNQEFILSSISNITERKRAEEALREYERVIENSQDMIAVVGQDYQYVLANSQFLKYHLLNREQVIGRSVRDVVGGEVFEKVLKKNIDACFQGEAVRYEMKHRYPELGERDLLIQYFPVENPEGIRRIVSIIQDITDRKRAEQDRKNLDARIQRMEKMEALGTLAGGVAHDLNNILSGIVGYPDLILTQLPEDSPLKVSILAIKQSGQKAAEVVQDLMTLARRGMMSMEVLNWNSVISEYMKTPEQEKVQSLHPHVRFEILLESDLLSIKGSRVHLSNTLMNLASNAAEAIPERGVVTISTRNQYLERPVRGYDNVKEGDHVVLEVSDTGRGISTEDMSRIFEPFYTRKVTGRSGMGLGLSVVWATLKDHNGYIDVQSEEGGGTTFTLYFPVTREALTLDQPPVSLSDYMGKGETILVIDDAKEQRELVIATLSKLNYRVTSVSSGEAAIEYIKTGQPDLLILDMVMDPGMDGLETYARILESRPGQKAIIVSGFSETERVRQALDLGAGAFVKKPYTMEKIGQAVRRELDKYSLSSRNH